jgi:alpha-tubulin suppressor-like RCC1 family protein
VSQTDGGSPLTGATSMVAAGLSCVVMASKQAQCWGTNPHGQLGTGVGVYNPTTVVRASGAPLAGITRMLANHATACAFLDTGALMCWGRNDEGELGDGTLVSKNFPEPVKVTCP